MTTLATMRSRIQTLTNNHIAAADIDALINRVHQEEVESREWHYRQKRMTLASETIKSAGTIDIASGATTVYGTGTSFVSTDVGKYLRAGSTYATVPVEVTDVTLFPSALNFTAYTVTNSAVVTIGTSFGGVQATQAEFTVLNGNIRYTIDGSTPTTAVGNLILAGSSFTLTGHTNLDNFQMIAESTDAEVSVTTSRTTQELTIATAWPGAAVVAGTYELFRRYYTLPADVEDIQMINHAWYALREKTTYELDITDSDRSERADHWRYYARAGVDSQGQKLLEPWPVATTAQLYQLDYLAGHVDLVNDSDLALVPSAVMENKTLFDACLTVFAKTGDDRWMKLATGAEKRYNDAIARLPLTDSVRAGRIKQVLDLDGVGYNNGYLGYDYMVRHDG